MNFKISISFFKSAFFVLVVVFSFSILIPKVLAHDDLKVDEISVFPATPAVNQYCQITIKIKNIGTRSLFTSIGFSSFGYQFYNFQQTNLEYQTPGQDHMLDKDGYLSYKFSGKFTQATTTVLSFTINKTQELTEEKIGDNGYTIKLYDDDTLTKKITVYGIGKTDLGIESIALDRNFPIAREPFSISVTVKNYGPITITDDTPLNKDNIRVNYPDFYLKSFTYEKPVKSDYCKRTTYLSACNTYASFDDPLNTGDEIIYTYNGYYERKSEKSFGFTVNSNNSVAEENQANNSTTTKFMVYDSGTDVDDVKIYDIAVQKISSSSATIFWQTDRKTIGQVLLRKKTIYAPDEFSPTTVFGLKHSVELKDLLPNTKHWLLIKATASTTPKFSEIQEFNMPASDIPIITTGPTVAVTGSNAKIAWQTNLLANSSVIYYKLSDKERLQLSNDTDTFEHEINLSNLASAAYEYYVISTSTLNWAVTSNKFTFRVGSITEEVSNPASNNQNPTATPITSITSGPPYKIKNKTLFNSLAGKIILKVEAKGEAYYINPINENMYFLGRPEDAFAVMREQGIGIANANLTLIPIGLTDSTGLDSDNDGLIDSLEDAIGTNKTKSDTDGDGYSDKDEIIRSYDPNGPGKTKIDSSFANRNKGKIFLQVENKGEAWYINRTDGQRYFLGRPADAFAVMRQLGTGISNKDFNNL